MVEQAEEQKKIKIEVLHVVRATLENLLIPNKRENNKSRTSGESGQGHAYALYLERKTFVRPSYLTEVERSRDVKYNGIVLDKQDKASEFC